MSSYLRNLRPILSLLRRCKPAQPPLTRCYRRAPAPLLPAASPPTHLVRGWLQKPWMVNTAAFLTYSTVSFLPHAVVFAIRYAPSYEETVPYTNRVHRVIMSRSDEKKYGDLAFDPIKKKLGDNILGPSDPNTVRVRRMANDIIREIHGILLTESPCEDDDDDNNGGSSLKDPSLVPNGSSNRQGKVAVLPQTAHVDELNWEVIVVRDKRIKAEARLGGKIVVHTGLLDYLDTDAKIATVLAHEIAHVVARHVTEITNYIPFPFHDELLPFSRRMEIEADHIGIMLLAAAGFDPLVAPKVRQKLGATGGDCSWDDYIASHPSPKTRSQLLSQDKVMDKALELYHRRVCTTEGTNRRFP